jgi:ribosomal protein S26
MLGAKYFYWSRDKARSDKDHKFIKCINCGRNFPKEKWIFNRQCPCGYIMKIRGLPKSK